MAETFQRAGWYPDPDGTPGERWWNGTSWSDSRRTPGATTVTSPSAAPVIYSASSPAPQRPDPYATMGVGPSTPRAAMSIDARANRNAMIGFVTGIIAMVFNFLGILGPVAIVFSALGIVKARQLKAQGAANNLMVFALIGLLLGLIATIIGFVTFIVFIVTVFSDATIA
ncbi:MAG: hypothetical protein JWP85_1485 [Rhodoglobus sp.]|nr:hypothetical protein [Rhodoglobus sp.]